MHPIYQDASRVLAQTEQKQGTIRRLAIADAIKNKKATLAIASETMRFSQVLEECMAKAGIAKRQRDFQPWILKVMVYEFLMGKGKLQCGGAVSRLIKDHGEQLRSALSEKMQEKGASAHVELLPLSQRGSDPLPRHVRINTLKTTKEAVFAALEEDGYSLVDLNTILHPPAAGEGGARQRPVRCFAQDDLLPEVLVFPSGTDLHAHPLIEQAHLRMQDKASCLPAHVLADGGALRFGSALDACAAPGNKTTHLSALMQNEGQLIAFELDAARAKMLKGTVQLMGARNVAVRTEDFLQADPNSPPFDSVQAILLDPSCSGTGIPGREKKKGGERSEADQHRLERLCAFQKKALAHALSFPNLHRLVYSTCSVHREENEEVVAEGLASARGAFTLEHVLPSWPRRGLPESFPLAPRCIRVTPEDHAMGFFLACFVRDGAKQVSGSNPTRKTQGRHDKKSVSKATLQETVHGEEPERAPQRMRRSELARQARFWRLMMRVQGGVGRRPVGRRERSVAAMWGVRWRRTRALPSALSPAPGSPPPSRPNGTAILPV